MKYMKEEKYKKKCVFCGADFWTKNKLKKYCSDECKNAAAAMRKENKRLKEWERRVEENK